MSHQPRRQIMIDQAVQGALIARVVLYWLLCLSATALSSWCFSVWTGRGPGLTSDGHLTSLWAILAGSLIVLPLAIADIIRVSNRFVGPVHSLRNALRRVALRDPVRPLEFRETDHWRDLVIRFNHLLPRLTGDSPDAESDELSANTHR